MTALGSNAEAPEGDSQHPLSLRILIICQRDLARASTKQAMAFAEGLAARGHSVLISLRGDPVTVAQEGIVASPALRISFRREFLFRVATSTLEEARHFDPDIIHVFNPRHYTVTVAKRFCAAAPTAAIVVHWEDDEFGIREGVVRRNPARQGARLAKRILCYPWPQVGVFVTGASLSWVRTRASMCDALTPALSVEIQNELGLPCTTVLPIMMSTNVQKGATDPLSPHASAIGELPTVAYTGSVHTESIDDFRVAAEAVALANESGVQVNFVYAGISLKRFDLASIVEEEGLAPGRFVDLGYMSFSSLQRVLRDATVLVQPGRADRFNRLRLPSKVQAYLTSGTPTVMFSVGFGELLRDGEEVVKLHSFSAVELSRHILDLVRSPERASRIGQGGIQAARRLFDRDRNLAALEHCYEMALGRRSSLQ